jgi:hypothetical protein
LQAPRPHILERSKCTETYRQQYNMFSCRVALAKPCMQYCVISIVMFVDHKQSALSNSTYDPRPPKSVVAANNFSSLQHAGWSIIWSCSWSPTKPSFTRTAYRREGVVKTWMMDQRFYHGRTLAPQFPKIPALIEPRNARKGFEHSRPRKTSTPSGSRREEVGLPCRIS